MERVREKNSKICIGYGMIDACIVVKKDTIATHCMSAKPTGK